MGYQDQGTNQNYGVHSLLVAGFIIEHWTVGGANRISVNTCSKGAVYFGNFHDEQHDRHLALIKV